MRANTPSIHPSQSEQNSVRSRQADREESRLPIYCPGCGTQIQVQLGLCGQRFVEAILLQSRHVGTELNCHSCQTTFVYSQVAPLEPT